MSPLFLRLVCAVVCAGAALALWVDETLDYRWPLTGLLVGLACLALSFEVKPRR